MWAWVSTHYAPIIAIGSLILGAGAGVLNYIKAVDEDFHATHARIDTVRAALRENTTADTVQRKQLSHDLGELKCMVILSYQQADPTTCLLDK